MCAKCRGMLYTQKEADEHKCPRPPLSKRTKAIISFFRMLLLMAVIYWVGEVSGWNVYQYIHLWLLCIVIISIQDLKE